MSAAEPGATPLASPRRTSAAVMFVALASSVLAVLPSFMVGTLAVQIRAEIALSVAQLGLLISASLLTSAAMSAPLGSLIERRGATAGLRLATFTAAAAMAAIALVVDSLPTLVAFMLLAGIGHAAVHPAANLVLARRISSRRQGIAFGIKQASIPAGALVAGLAVPVASTAIGWRGVFLGSAIAAACVGLMAPVAATDAPKRAGRSHAMPTRIAPLVVLAVGAALAVGSIQPVPQFYVPFAVDVGMNASVAGTVLAVASLGSIVIRLLIGVLSGGRPPSTLFLVASAAILTAAVGPLLLGIAAARAVLGAPGWALVAGVMLAMCIGFGWNPIIHYAVVIAHLEAPAAASSITQTGLLVGAALGPLAFGALADWQSYAHAWLALALVLPLGAAMFFIAARMVRAEPTTER